MSDPQLELLRSLDEQRAEYARRRGLAMPLAGSIVWTLIGIAGAFLAPILAVWSLFIGTGFIAYLGMMLSRFPGENFLKKNKRKNAFASLFFPCVEMKKEAVEGVLRFVFVEKVLAGEAREHHAEIGD